MIARIWRGWVATSDADAYVHYVDTTGVAEYRATPGNLGAAILRRELADGRTEIVTLSFWETMEAIKGIRRVGTGAGVFYPQDDRYLVGRETTVTHLEVPVQSGLWPTSRRTRLAPTHD